MSLEKKKKSSENVEQEILEAKYEDLMRNHKDLIKTLKLLEEKHGEDLKKKQEEVEKLVNKIGALQQNQEKLEKEIEELMSSETEIKKGKKVKIELDKDVVMISDDDDDDVEGNQRKKSEFYFIV